MTGRRGRQGLALCAAYMLVLQSVMGVWASSWMPTLQTDIFRSSLCISGSLSDAGDHDGDLGDKHDCCALGCCVTSQMLAVGLDTDWLPSVLRPRQAGLPFGELRVVHARAHYPAYPRAPPALMA